MKELIIAVAVLASAAGAQDRRVTPLGSSQKRVALVIGNNEYRNQQPLRNSVNDANSVGAALRELSFTVDVKLNVSMIQMEEAVERFAGSVRPGDIALFYYSGHGIQVGDQNYLIPVDFEAHTAADAKYKAYAAGRVQDNLEAAGASLQILILDACRDNPYRSLRGAGGGLAAMQAGKGAYIAFATAPGKTADDNAGGRNGLFTDALLGALRQPGLTLDQVFNQVRAKVSSTRAEQVPWSTSSVVGEFYFVNGAAPSVNVTRLDAASESWALIRNSQNPEDFDDFARSFPSSELAASARARAAQLRRATGQLNVGTPVTQAPAPAASSPMHSAPSLSTSTPAENHGDSFLICHNHDSSFGPGILTVGRIVSFRETLDSPVAKILAAVKLSLEPNDTFSVPVQQVRFSYKPIELLFIEAADGGWTQATPDKRRLGQQLILEAAGQKWSLIAPNQQLTQIVNALKREQTAAAPVRRRR
jgi:hypothetical protein